MRTDRLNANSDIVPVLKISYLFHQRSPIKSPELDKSKPIEVKNRFWAQLDHTVRPACLFSVLQRIEFGFHAYRTRLNKNSFGLYEDVTICIVSDCRLFVGVRVL